MRRNILIAEIITNELIAKHEDFVRQEPCRCCMGELEFNEDALINIIWAILDEENQ